MRHAHIALAIASIAAACRRDAPSAPPSLALAPPPPVYAGCAAVLDGPVCEIAAGATLTLWLRTGPDLTAPDFSLRAAFDGRPANAVVTPLDDGRQIRVEVPAGARRVAMTIARGTASGTWALALSAPVPVPALDDAAARRAAGELEEAADALRAALVTLPEAARGRAHGALARIALQQGRARDAVTQFERAVAANRASGRRSDAASDALTWAFGLATQLEDVAGALARLDDTARWIGDDQRNRAALVYYRGLFALQTGDLRGALRDLPEAAALSRRVGLDDMRRYARQQWAMALQAVGRADEAADQLDALLEETPADSAACERADLLANAGWQRVLAREARVDAPWRVPEPVVRATRLRGRDVSPMAPTTAPTAAPGPPDAVGMLGRALEARASTCPHAVVEASTRVDLALALFQGGDAAAARIELDRARALSPGETTFVAGWRAAIEIRIALGDGRVDEAIEQARALRDRAEAALDPAMQWRAAVELGHALRRAGRDGEAAAAWTDAERRLDDQMLAVPLTEGRDTFLGDRERSARLLVGLLVELGRSPEAYAAARRSRARVLTRLQRVERLAALDPEARARWTRAIGIYRAARTALESTLARARHLPGDERAAALAEIPQRERALRGMLDDALAVVAPAGSRPVALRAPAPPAAMPDAGVLRLAYHPTTDGWAGFAATRNGIVARAVGPPPVEPVPAALSHWLLAPFADAIVRAQRVELLPYGPLRRADLHALPPFADAKPVVFAVDLPAAIPAVPTGVAVVIADPTGDLVHARRGADAVRRAFESAGFGEVRTLIGRDADAASVRRALSSAARLHYEGHAAFEGRGGWESALRLADGGRVTVGDVLALPSVPAHVLLSGCETARTTDDAPVETLGLAQAFVVRGAQAVVATIRPVDDALAAEVTRALYRHGYAAASAAEVPGCVARALADVRRARPDADWATFRVWVP